jgi:hypothetical protein
MRRFFFGCAKRQPRIFQRGSATESIIRDLESVSRDLETCKYIIDLLQVGAAAMLQVDQDLNKKLARKNNE